MIAKKRVLPMLVGLLVAGGASVAHACYYDDDYYGGYGYGHGRGYGMMGMGPGMMGPWSMGPGMMRGYGYGAGPGMPSLTEQQQNKIAQIQAEVSRKHGELMGQMNAEQIKFQQLIYSGKQDPVAIDAQRKKIYQLQLEIDESRFDAQRRMNAVLGSR